MSTHKPTTRDGVLIAAMVGIVAVCVTAAVMRLMNMPAGVEIGLIGAVGLLSVGVVSAMSRRRVRGLGALHEAIAAWRDDPATPAAPKDPAIPTELMPLASTLSELGVRVQSRLKSAQKNTRNLEALIDAIDEPILATDNAERVLICNRSAERLLDTPQGGLIGRSIHSLFTQAAILELHAAARGGQTRRERVRVTTALGQRVFQVTASPVPVAWGEGVFGAVLALRDVTELDHAAAMQTDFVANASHELRTPVAAIRGAAETLQTASDDPPMSARLRDMILSNAVRLEEMLRDLLDLSRLETPDVPVELSTIDLEQLSRDVAQMSEAHCQERGLTLSFEIEPRLRAIRSDRKLLSLILRNLIENATKFAHENTTIRVTATIVHAGSAPALSVVRISVADQGIGIPLAAQERVFERYYQADPGRGSHLRGWRRGTGLGLAIVKHAAQALGGKAALSSVWGQGTTVWVEFPAEVMEQGAVSVRSSTSAAG